MHITYVKKRFANGTLCNKCADVQRRLEESGQITRIDEIVIADETDPSSSGMILAAEFNVDRAPFFVVREAGGAHVYESYFKFVRETLGAAVTDKEAATEILEQNPELDLI
ncbi:MAG: hypothetical protein QF921_10150 [Pseudomonadales bacterium]|jgi:hypothetical protein|nr:hypothetical protein [Pseudomonadales bacterium]MDP6473100.1 hypothetical protein [Pseudomonadales bacterium]MDP6826143.1 hypothetical protein [Pseudomonadales bacterium]MDP6971856.1 hypothetical protein [Pseudomonadales bacterium]|tara:strand:+ start:1985 stop:2317 length:333 start_codon:yes stop_codon:yes gene_type:complete